MSDIATDKDEAHEHYLRALTLELADPQAARSAYEACLAGDCAHLEARVNLGRLLHLEKRHTEAEAIYRGADDADATLYFNLAILLEDQGKDADAARSYREAIVHDPGMADAHLNLSLLLERQGDAQSAYRHLLAYHRLVEAHKSPADFSDDIASED